jgi:hypothetical protein
MYSKSLIKEIQEIIENNNPDCSIEKFQDKVNWSNISIGQKLSEEFIEKFQDKVNLVFISRYQKLSEYFIEKFQDKVDWIKISIYQKLSESFIEEFQDKVDWDYISMDQKLSEEFIEKLQNKVDWNFISKYQKLSEEFIEKFQDKVYLDYISKYQKLSPQFREKYNIIINEDNWLYKPVNFKLKYIKEHTNYEIIDDKYIIAYKGIRSDNYSKYNFHYQYEVGKTYESHCDCNCNDDSSFGLSAWNIEKAKEYCDEKIIKVKIAIKDIGAIVREENKIRCFKFEVLEEVKEQ